MFSPETIPVSNELKSSFGKYTESYTNLFSSINFQDVDADFAQRVYLFKAHCYNIRGTFNEGRVESSSKFEQDLLASIIKHKFDDLLNKRNLPNHEIKVFIDYPITIVKGQKTNKIMPDVIACICSKARIKGGKKNSPIQIETHPFGIVELKTNRGYHRQNWYQDFLERHSDLIEANEILMNKNPGWTWDKSEQHEGNFDQIAYKIDPRIDIDKLYFLFVKSSGNLMSTYKDLGNFLLNQVADPLSDNIFAIMERCKDLAASSIEILNWKENEIYNTIINAHFPDENMRKKYKNIFRDIYQLLLENLLHEVLNNRHNCSNIDVLMNIFEHDDKKNVVFFYSDLKFDLSICKDVSDFRRGCITDDKIAADYFLNKATWKSKNNQFGISYLLNRFEENFEMIIQTLS